ncbi:MAG: periplasmic copper chaperone [Propionibacteriaceae bacterium]|jgi:uncharacterized protein YcnI|nr:hypothetical protein [Propionibacteriaceae bacterium]MDX6323454.1 periplasmic copper chaperone [Propionibacteriaceae bacterium]
MTPTQGTHRAVRGAATIAAAAGLVALSATTAAAHVSVSPNSSAAGGFSLLTLSVSHGCDGSPTTRLDMKIPDGINAVTPTVTDGWTVTKVMSTLDTPITDSHGSTITERVSEVVYTAKTPLPDGYRAAFELSMQLPDKAGETLAFPTVQTCERGEAAWIEIPDEGQTEDDLEAPAPAFTITAAAAGEHVADVDTHPTAEPRTAADETTASAAGAVAWAALALGAIGAVLGGLGFARSRRS